MLPGRYQNFQNMMLGGCAWNHLVNTCEPVRKPAGQGGGFVTARDVLSNFVFVGVNEHFKGARSVEVHPPLHRATHSRTRHCHVPKHVAVGAVGAP